MIHYHPNEFVAFDDQVLRWQTPRPAARKIMLEAFEVADHVTDLSEYHNGHHSHDIHQRRDIYTSYHGRNASFFLNYDNNELLSDIEVHSGLAISIAAITINFEMDLDVVEQSLDTLSTIKHQISEGEILYPELKLVIASSAAMGGDGNKLRYFYCCNDVSHLEE